MKVVFCDFQLKVINRIMQLRITGPFFFDLLKKRVHINHGAEGEFDFNFASDGPFLFHFDPFPLKSDLNETSMAILFHSTRNPAPITSALSERRMKGRGAAGRLLANTSHL